MIAWLAANWGWLVALVLWGSACVFAGLVIAAVRQQDADDELLRLTVRGEPYLLSQEELRRVRDLARDDTN
jgi:hypothetical protein